ncbi:hypothetical protein NPIL_365941 [Nephila pilipes]|uniref:Uncharacterized protein n=1 Tax=Nephila pilipes TaxID=299642 RepID=A0A8X6Q3H7_NEPPI|nr:hypothetical protein NPIL_365941 [Nephila pilipes]
MQKLCNRRLNRGKLSDFPEEGWIRMFNDELTMSDNLFEPTQHIRLQGEAKKNRDQTDRFLLFKNPIFFSFLLPFVVLLERRVRWKQTSNPGEGSRKRKNGIIYILEFQEGRLGLLYAEEIYIKWTEMMDGLKMVC